MLRFYVQKNEQAKCILQTINVYFVENKLNDKFYSIIIHTANL